MGNLTTRNARNKLEKQREKGGGNQEQGKLKRTINFRKISEWSLGSLSDRRQRSFDGSSRSFSVSKSKNKTKNYKRYNSAASRQYSKTNWPIPISDSIFQPHFKRANRNDNFVVDKVIARGAFGIVFKILDKNHTNLEYALKVLSKSKVIQNESVQQLKDEVDIQKVCSHHPFIVKQLDSWQNKRHLHILLEYISGGELFTTICRFPYELARLYVAEIALAIDFLHNAGIIYRDVKSENILLSADYHIKITDFGLSKWLKFGERTKTMCGTFQYMAPEILNGEMYGHAVDWWSIGVLACRMFTNKYPNTKVLMAKVDDASDENLPSNIATKQLLPRQVDALPRDGKDLLNRLLEIDPKVRLKSVMAMQKIAMFKNFTIKVETVKQISPLELLRNFPTTSTDLTSKHNSATAPSAFKDF